MSAVGSPVLRFRDFELDLVRYELRRGGARIKLQRIPMDLLVLLIEQRGALVTRDEIVKRIWGSDMQLDPEGSVNTAIRKIRQALVDQAEQPRFVETVVGKGYRFLAEVTTPALETQTQPEPKVIAPLPLIAKPPSRPLSWIACASALVAIGLIVWRATSHSPPAPAIRLVPFTSFPGAESGPSFSPDGQRIAFSWKDEKSREAIYVKSIGSDSPIRMTSSPDSESNPAWSPDGRWIAFLRHDAKRSVALWIVPASGGSPIPVRVLSNPNVFRPAWTPDGSGIVVAEADRTGAARRLTVIARDGSESTKITSLASTGTGDWQPAYSPDGQTLAYLRNTGSASSSWLHTVRVNNKGLPVGEPRLITTDRFDLLGIDWSADGRSLICATRAEMVRIPATGGNADSLPVTDATSLSVARTGNRLVYARSTRDTDIFRLPGPGQVQDLQRLVTSTRLEGAPQYSPDGARLALVSERSGSPQVWIADNTGGGMHRLSSMEGGGVGCPRWSPDGGRIAFDALRGGRPAIFVVPSAGGAASTLGDPGNAVRPSWSRDGHWIYFGSDRSGKWEIWKTPTGGGTPLQFTHSGGREAFEDHAGKFVYYTKEKPEEGIWRVPVSGGSAEQITDQGSQGRWAIGERGVYYLNSAEELELLELPSGRRRSLPMYGLRAATGTGGGLMTVGPGDRWILIAGLVRSDSDLTLVENFR